MVRDLLLPIGQNLHLRECAGAVEVHIRNEMLSIEHIDPRSERLGDVMAAHVFSDGASVLCFHKPVVIADPWSSLQDSLICSLAVTVRVDMAGELSRRVTGDETEELPQESLFRSRYVTVVAVEQTISEPYRFSGCGRTVFQREDICGLQECFDLFNGLEL